MLHRWVALVLQRVHPLALVLQRVCPLAIVLHRVRLPEREHRPAPFLCVTVMFSRRYHWCMPPTWLALPVVSQTASSRLAGWIGTTSLPPMRRKNSLCAWGGGVYEVDLTTLRGCSQLAVTSSGESCFLSLSACSACSQPSLSLAVAGFTCFPSQYGCSLSGDVPFFHISSRDPFSLAVQS